MKKLVFFTILLLGLTSCNQGVPTLKFEGLNGKVQSVRESRYEALEKFGEAIADELDEVLIMDFDKAGHLLRYFLYDEDGDRKYGWEHVYEGDVVVQTKNYVGRAEEPSVTELLSNGKTQFDYKYTDKDTTYTYTSNLFEDNLYRKFTYTASDTEVELWFNEKGQVLEQKQTSKGEVLYWALNKYNDDYMLAETEYRGDYPSRISYKYTEFDSKGNWITAIMFQRGNTYLLKREIRYW